MHHHDAAKAIRTGNKEYLYTIDDVLIVGRILIEEKKYHRSHRKYGEALKEKYPEIAAIRSNVRSDIIFVTNIHDGAQREEFLRVLGVEKLSDYRTPHPSMIRRHYRKRKNL